MQSPFDLDHQNIGVESRIVAAMERVSEAFRVLLWDAGKIQGLSPIQVQLLIFLRFHAREKCKVSYLAQEFNMTKATISDSIRLLVQKGLIERMEDPADTRSHTIGLTEAGKEAATQVSGFAAAIERPIHALSEDQKAAMLASLLHLIHDLNRAGIITIQRMCLTCAHHRHEKGEHYCTLLRTRLAIADLRLDCPEHLSV